MMQVSCQRVNLPGSVKLLLTRIIVAQV